MITQGREHGNADYRSGGKAYGEASKQPGIASEEKRSPRDV